MVVRPQIMLIVALVFVSAGTASAQPKKGKDAPAKKDDKKDEKKGDDKSDKKAEPKVFDFTGIQFEGRLRTPQLLYFLDRASEELERASLERRSFIPELVRTIDEEQL